ncbi:MAG TPA: queuosine salvage family protein [Solirubrobacterales bacterium]|nr:queuosine salvage family protein [Solirubrobacterales bacterium]
MAAESTAPIPEMVREACAWVAARARSVRIEEEAVSAYAAGLGSGDDGEAGGEDPAVSGDREARAAFVVCLDAINFGSGWWPTIRKRPSHSGYRTVEAGLRERFEAHGPWSADELCALDRREIAAVLGQDREHPLMADFAVALRDVGGHLRFEHGGRFEALVDNAGGSAVTLANLLAGWAAFEDVSTYEGRFVPFYKRAQLAAADLDRAGVAGFGDLGRLTTFADNLVPHVLRVDGVLRFEPNLTAAIEAGELLEHGSPAEVELRACAVQAVELLAGARRSAGHGAPLSASEIDAALWNRGRDLRYKALPRPRSRNTAY